MPDSPPTAMKPNARVKRAHGQTKMLFFHVAEMPQFPFVVFWFLIHVNLSKKLSQSL
jgi:hypothetical protein